MWKRKNSLLILMGLILGILVLALLPNGNILEAEIEGRVVRGANELPVSNYKLVVEGTYYEDGDRYSATPVLMDTVYTDAEGRFSLAFERVHQVQFYAGAVSRDSFIKELYVQEKRTTVKVVLEE